MSVDLSDRSVEELYEIWERELAQVVRPADVALIASIELEAERRGVDLTKVLNGLTAAWDPSLHPRGHDGKFINVGGLIKLIGYSYNGKDGQKKTFDGRRGKVMAINKDPKDPDNPKIRVALLDKDGKASVVLDDVKPKNIEQAPEKARLDAPDDGPEIDPREYSPDELDDGPDMSGGPEYQQTGVEAPADADGLEAQANKERKALSIAPDDTIVTRGATATFVQHPALPDGVDFMFRDEDEGWLRRDGQDRTPVTDEYLINELDMAMANTPSDSNDTPDRDFEPTPDGPESEISINGAKAMADMHANGTFNVKGLSEYELSELSQAATDALGTDGADDDKLNALIDTIQNTLEPDLSLNYETVDAGSAADMTKLNARGEFNIDGLTDQETQELWEQLVDVQDDPGGYPEFAGIPAEDVDNLADKLQARINGETEMDDREFAESQGQIVEDTSLNAPSERMQESIDSGDASTAAETWSTYDDATFANLLENLNAVNAWKTLDPDTTFKILTEANARGIDAKNPTAPEPDVPEPEPQAVPEAQVTGPDSGFEGSAVKLLDGADATPGSQVINVKDGQTYTIEGVYNNPKLGQDAYVRLRDADGKLSYKSKRSLKAASGDAPAAEPSVPAPAAPAPTPKAPAPAPKAKPKSMTDPDIVQKIANTDMSLAEDGAGYDTLSLLFTRRDQISEEIQYARENGDKYITLKVPSGSEQSIPLDVAEAYAAANGIFIP